MNYIKCVLKFGIEKYPCPDCLVCGDANGNCLTQKLMCYVSSKYNFFQQSH